MVEICVMMSSYNGGKYIRRQIDSILNQKDCSVCLHVRDDGSSDDTVEILREYEKKGLLTLHQGPNLGPAYSFLQLLKEVRDHTWYAFADQDDVWYEDKLIRAIERLKGETVPALCYENAELITADEEKMGIRVYRNYHPEKKHTIACVGALLGCTIVFNAKLAECIQNYPLPERIRMHDYYLAQVCLACGGKILYEDYVSMGYRQHGNNVVGMQHSKIAALKQRINDLRVVRDPSVADHGKSICTIYDTRMSEADKKLFSLIAHYRDSLKNRLLLSGIFDGRDVSRSMRLKYRWMIILGKL